VSDVLRKMLAKRPEDRYQTPGEVALALAAVDGSANASAPIPSAGSIAVGRALPVARPVGLHRSRKIAIAASLLALALGAALLAGLRRPHQGTVSSQPETTKPSPTDLSLLGHWKFTEGRGASAADASGNGQNATIHNGKWSRGRDGSAIFLNGQDAYIDYGTSERFNFANGSPFTFAGWVKTRANYGPIVAQRNNQPGRVGTLITIGIGSHGDVDKPGCLVVLVRDDRQPNDRLHCAEVLGPVINDDRWHHFALVRRAGRTLTLYVDGAAKAAVTSEAASGSITTDLRIFGSDPLWVRVGTRPELCFFNGGLEDLRIYKRALSDRDIASLAKSVD
jgi:hypothetical protein